MQNSKRKMDEVWSILSQGHRKDRSSMRRMLGVFETRNKKKLKPRDKEFLRNIRRLMPKT